MIYAFTGKTGSGKTFQMIKTAYADWLRGADTYSNTVLFFGKSGACIDKNPEEFSYFERTYEFFYSRLAKALKREYIPKQRGRIVYFENINEILEVSNGNILFDEAQVLFNARNWESLPDEFQYKLQQHRKHRLNLLCTTQNMGTIDIMYRRLVQVWWHHEEVFKIGESPVKFAVFRQKQKDIDELYNNIDDLKAPDVSSRLFFITRWTRALYDTLYDIGFKRFRTQWLTLYDPTTRKMVRKFLILPKKMSLKEGQMAISSLRSNFYPSRSSYSSRR